MPVSVFRRYTPPTCTLELQGTRSPLSLWSDRPIVKQIQFSLSIDGPHRLPEQRITIEGECSQLDELYQVVSTYVQKTLQLSAEQFQATIIFNPSASNPAKQMSHPPTTLSDLTLALQRPSDPADLSSSNIVNAANAVEWSPRRAPTGDSLGYQPGQPTGQRHTGQPSTASTHAVDLVPQGLLKHQLLLGSLATPSTPSAITLTTTELFDLANALDAYHGEVDSIPELNAQQHRRTPAPWLKVAALAVFAFGVGATLVQLSQSSEPEEIALQDQGDRADQSAVERRSNREAATKLKLPDIPSATNELPPSSPNPANPKPGKNPANSRQANNSNNSQGSDGSELANGTLTPTDPTASPLGSNNQPENSASLGRSAESTDSVRSAPTDMPQTLTAIPPVSADSADDIFLDSSEMNLSAPSAAPSQANQGNAASRAGAAPVPRPSAPDTSIPGVNAYPQLAEVQSYFAERWKPPAYLKQPLQYRLRLNPDGSLQQAIPMGESARTSGSLVDFPAVGEPFVSSFGGNNAPPIRLFLGSDGKVRVFLESLD